MKTYAIAFYNRFACETQIVQINANNEEDAIEKFYEEHDKAAYHECIESIRGIKTEKTNYQEMWERLEKTLKRQSQIEYADGYEMNWSFACSAMLSLMEDIKNGEEIEEG